MTNNPLLQDSKLKHNAVPFSLIKIEHYIPAIEKSISIAKDRIEKIKNSDASFINTILGLEHCSHELDRVLSVYYNLHSAHSSEEHQALAMEVAGLSSNFSSDISLDEVLFSKVKTVFDKKDQLNLEKEELKLLENTYKSFARNGALLSSEKKEQLRKIDEEKAKLSPKFSDNVLKATNAFELLVENEKDMQGIPEGVQEAAKELAEQKNLKGYLFNLQAPSLIPFLTYCKNRDLRKKLYMASASKSLGGEWDNRELIKKIVHLRHERAKLLGFDAHSDYILSERMAQSSNAVIEFLQQIESVSHPAAEKDVDEVRSLAKQLDGLKEISPWDFAYYSEILKKKKFKFDEEELRPYFPLEKVIEGAFSLASKLYNLKFVESQDFDTYHPDVQVFEVYDKENKNFVGLFYADFFPRETKRGGAWMTEYVSQGYKNDVLERPHVSIVCNFTKPTSTKPSLLTFDEVETLFHEFGHSLHGLLSDCKYKSLSGTSVFWDFVELPSQFMENFLLEKEVLDTFAEHYKTKKKIPKALVDKLKKASTFQAGYFSLRQIRFGMLDMAWHIQEGDIEDVESFEKEITKSYEVLPSLPGTCSSCSFSHIFAGGYSAGYYSYKWAEVLDADAFEYFKENGILNPKIAKKFKDNILSKGGSEHPMELYKKFRGREPDPNALLRRDGLV